MHATIQWSQAFCAHYASKTSIKRAIYMTFGLKNINIIQNFIKQREYPKISVIIPVYNSEKYLNKCISSILKQTFKDIEIICVDDYSSDASLKILKEFAKQDSRIKVIHLNKNKRAGGARNAGLKVARGKYITFIDSDDCVENKYCEVLYNAIEKQCADIVIAKISNYTNSNDPTLIDLKNKFDKIYQQTYQTGGLINFSMNDDTRFRVGPVAKLYKAEIIKSKNLKFPENIIQEDEAFYWYYMLEVSRVYVVEEILYNRLLHEKSIMYQKYIENKNVEDYLSILNYIYNYLKKNNVLEKYFDAFKRYFLRAKKSILNNKMFDFDELAMLTENFKILELKFGINQEKSNTQNSINKRLSVVIPVYNALDDVKLLLKSLRKNFNFKLGNILIVNDCSNEKTSKYLKEFTTNNKKFKLIENETNLGFIKSCNKGISIVDGEIVVLLNSDTIIPENFCEKIIKCFDSNPKIGLASPISSGSCTYFIQQPKGYSLKKMNRLINKKHLCKYPEIAAAEGFCFCIRKELINQQGLLDEIYGKGYHEEVDYAYRAITNGWTNVLIDDLYVYHKRQASFGIERRQELIKQNNPVFNKRWNGFRNDYELKNNLKNPVIKISEEIFPDGNPALNNVDRGLMKRYEFVFSVKNSINKRYKILTFFGITFKFKIRTKNVIYTCITNPNDRPVQLTNVNKAYDYICYTNNKKLLKRKRIGQWKIRKIQSNEPNDYRNILWHKINAYRLFPHCEHSIWIDKSVNIIDKNFFKYIKTSPQDIIIPQYCSDTKTDIIYRKHNETDVIKISKEWWRDAQNSPDSDSVLRDILVRYEIAQDKVFISKQEIDAEIKAISQKQTILLVSHEMTYTGACHSLLRICKILKDKYNLVVWTKRHGAFEKEFFKLGINVIYINDLNSMIKSAKTYDLAICNTLLTDYVYDKLKNKVPTIWYIREAKNIKRFIEQKSASKNILESAKNIYCVSEYAKNFITQNYNKNVKIVHNATEDYNDNYAKTYLKNGKLRILLLGTFNPRKAYDIVLKALKLLPDELFKKVDVTIAGALLKSCKFFYQPILNEIHNIKNINYIGEITDLNTKIDLYRNTDLVIVPSRDESCSLVVLEALMMNCPVIVSENVGAKYLIDNSLGWIFKTNDYNELSDILIHILNNTDVLDKMGKNARQKYLETSTMGIYRTNILNMIEDNIRRK